MTNNSLLKCAGALTSILLYTFMFGFVRDIDTESLDGIAIDQSPEFHNSRNKAETTALYGDPVVGYRTTIKATNDQKPTLSDYPVSTTAPIDSARNTPPPSTYEVPTVIITDAPQSTTVPPYAESVTKPTITSSNRNITATTNRATDLTTAGRRTENLSELDELEEENEFHELEELPDSPSVAAAITTTSATKKTLRGRTIDGEQLTVICNGKEVTDSALNIVSKIVQTEIGSAFNVEAIKAQAVASYTYVKQYNEYYNTPASVYMSNVASSRVTSTVSEVLGEAIYYNGEYIQAVYCASTAGYSASSETVWGTDLPYLRSVNTPYDKTYDSNYGVTKKFSSSDIMKRVLETTGISLSGDPSNWFEILSHVDNVYVGTISVGGKTTYTKDGTETEINGRTFREHIMDYDIRSACFEIDYNKSSDMFTFTTYGYGHGVGMSQNGANTLAKVLGYDYIQILKYYYPGTEVK